ncbi:MAG: hypothetical protein GY822_29685 [Deltaproteobacteria bacterium]|nr:hypothetical protein [Deltaproteobacteria bacterium]
MRKVVGVALICGPLLVVGCAQEPDIREGFPGSLNVNVQQEVLVDFADEDPPPDPSQYADDDGLLSGSLDGAMGPVTVNTKEVYFSSWKGASYTEINTIAPNANGGAAMSILLIRGDLDQFEVGDVFVFNWDNNAGDNELWVDAIGCSGPQDGRWTYFDVPADEVVLSIEEGPEPGTQMLSYHAHFSNNWSTTESDLRGYVVYEVDRTR